MLNINSRNENYVFLVIDLIRSWQTIQKQPEEHQIEGTLL